MLLLTLAADWLVVAVVAVVFESDELAKLDEGAADDLLIIFLGGALPFLKVLEKFPFADPGCF